MNQSHPVLEPAIYDRVLSVAREVSMDLHAAIAGIGPIEIAPPAHASVAERLFVAIINQQISTKAALAIWTRIEAAALAQERPLRDLFVPGHEAVLRSCGVSGNKVRALQSIVEADATGLFDADLAAMPHPERSAILCRVRGIGQWTADMIGIFHFLDHDIWPVGDVAAVASLRRLTGQDDTVALAAAFAPYRSILARYAWRAKDVSMRPLPE